MENCYKYFIFIDVGSTDFGRTCVEETRSIVLIQYYNLRLSKIMFHIY
jgi:hypothetical protein